LQAFSSGGALYAFASELGCLRIFQKYNRVPSAKVVGRQGFSQNMNRWYFSLEM